MSTLETSMILDLDCEGEFIRGSRASFNPGMGQWYPGEPDHVDNFAVYLIKANGRINITQFLTEHQIEQLKEKFIEQESS